MIYRPNVQHLQRSQFRNRFLLNPMNEVSVAEFGVENTPFMRTVSRQVPVSCSHPLFGFSLGADELNNRVYVKDLAGGCSSAVKAFKSKTARANVRNAFLVRINGKPVFTRDDALARLQDLRSSGAQLLDLEFATEKLQTAKAVRQAIDELDIFCSTDELLAALNVEDIRAIASIQFPDLDFSPESLQFEEAELLINAIRSDATTEAQMSLGHFTRRKLKALNTWPLWHAGEVKQLNQFWDLDMYGEPVDRPPNAIVLRQHWQYHIKRDGERRARNCCDGSPPAAPILHRFAQTYSSCVEQPIQRLFFSLAATLGYLVFAADTQDAFAHSPLPEHPTYAAIDDAYPEWYEERF